MEILSRSTSISFLLFALFFSCICAGSSSSSTDFIRSSCKATRYPALCVSSLSPYASAIRQSPKNLAQTALAVSLARTRSVSALASKLSGARNGLKKSDLAALKDCLDNIGDSVDELARSARELSRMGSRGSPSFSWQVSNVQTWVSAALTDDNTCVDGLLGPAVSSRLKVPLKARIVDAAQVTSNALALVNRYAEHAHSTTVANPQRFLFY